MTYDYSSEKLIAWRRHFHHYAESAWQEYGTAAFIAQELATLGYDLALGEEVLSLEDRMGLPTPEVMQKAKERALAEGANPIYVKSFADGKTALVARLKGLAGSGKRVAFRFDMDCVEVTESLDKEHIPAREGFASCHEGSMHACGHDGHMAIGLGVAHFFKAHQKEIKGEIVLIFQPGEEGVRGAKAMVEKGVVDDIDVFFAFHLGLDRQLVDSLACTNTGFLATTKIDAHFTGQAAHGGNSPEEGASALLAAATAALQLQGLPRHSQGMSRINVGVLHAGSGRNVIPDQALLQFETRGSSTAINDFLVERSAAILQGAALSYGCHVKRTCVGAAPCMLPCPSLVHIVHEVALGLHLFKSVYKTWSAPCSEDATYFINRVIEKGGLATYLLIGFPMKGAHHNPTFDLDEKVLSKAVTLLGALGLHITRTSPENLTISKV